jgi:hypothetical protein
MVLQCADNIYFSSFLRRRCVCSLPLHPPAHLTLASVPPGLRTPFNSLKGSTGRMAAQFQICTYPSSPPHVLAPPHRPSSYSLQRAPRHHLTPNLLFFVKFIAYGLSSTLASRCSRCLGLCTRITNSVRKERTLARYATRPCAASPDSDIFKHVERSRASTPCR